MARSTQRIGFNSNPTIFYGNLARFKEFFGSAVAKDAPNIPGGIRSIRAHTRRQYPGDVSPVSVSAHDITVPEMARSDRATPGDVYTVRTKDKQPNGKYRYCNFSTTASADYLKSFLPSGGGMTADAILFTPGGMKILLDVS